VERIVNFSQEAFEPQATLCYDFKPCGRKFEIYINQVKTQEHNTVGFRLHTVIMCIEFWIQHLYSATNKLVVRMCLE